MRTGPTRVERPLRPGHWRRRRWIGPNPTPRAPSDRDRVEVAPPSLLLPPEPLHHVARVSIRWEHRVEDLVDAPCPGDQRQPPVEAHPFHLERGKRQRLSEHQLRVAQYRVGEPNPLGEL